MSCYHQINGRNARAKTARQDCKSAARNGSRRATARRARAWAAPLGLGQAHVLAARAVPLELRHGAFSLALQGLQVPRLHDVCRRQQVITHGKAPAGGAPATLGPLSRVGTT